MARTSNNRQSGAARALLEEAHDMIFWNIIKAWVCYRWAKLFGYQVMAEGQDQSDRLTKCEICPFHVEGICIKCGCLTYAKTMLNTEQCPDKRWLRIWRKRVTTK